MIAIPSVTTAKSRLFKAGASSRPFHLSNVGYGRPRRLHVFSLSERWRISCAGGNYACNATRQLLTSIRIVQTTPSFRPRFEDVNYTFPVLGCKDSFPNLVCVHVLLPVKVTM